MIVADSLQEGTAALSCPDAIATVRRLFAEDDTQPTVHLRFHTAGTPKCLSLPQINKGFRQWLTRGSNVGLVMDAVLQHLQQPIRSSRKSSIPAAPPSPSFEEGAVQTAGPGTINVRNGVFELSGGSSTACASSNGRPQPSRHALV